MTQREGTSRAMVSRYRQYGDGHVVIAVHTMKGPSDAEWQEYLACSREMLNHLGARFTQVAGIAVTDGGAPSAAQRHQLIAALGGRHPVAAVVTNSTLIRGVVTALNWFDVRVKSYPPSEFAAALQRIGIKDQYHAEVVGEVISASRELSTMPATVDLLRYQFRQ